MVSAGDSAFWTNLKWVFRMKDDTSIRVFVGSKDKTIGTTAFSPQDVYINSPDSNGLCKVIFTIHIFIARWLRLSISVPY